MTSEEAGDREVGSAEQQRPERCSCWEGPVEATVESRRGAESCGGSCTMSQVQKGDRSYRGDTDTSAEMIRLPVSRKVTAQEGVEMGPCSLHREGKKAWLASPPHPHPIPDFLGFTFASSAVFTFTRGLNYSHV